jgi:ribosome-binding protein aMBF1 (putative translation factor)
MSIKEIRYCDSCGKEIVGRLIAIPCPCCKKDICMECLDKAKESGSPKPVRKPKEIEQAPERYSLVLRGVAWEGPTRQGVVDAFRTQIGEQAQDSLITTEEQAEIDAFLKES